MGWLTRLDSVAQSAIHGLRHFFRSPRTAAKDLDATPHPQTVGTTRRYLGEINRAIPDRPFSLSTLMSR